jgi:histidinol-phosphate aminotransferase
MEIPATIAARMQPCLQGLEPYDPGFSACDINVSANENNLPVPPTVRSALDAALASTPLNRYPDPLSNELRAKIAARHGVAPENVLVTNGGDEALFLLFLAFGGPGRTLVDIQPTFSVYALYASMVGTSVETVLRDPSDFSIDWDALAAIDADLTIVTTPNNPTANLADKDALLGYVATTDALVLSDEAYMEFADEDLSVIPEIECHPNLIVLRTLSKAFGLAGARIGYLLADAGIVSALSAVRQPYSVNVLSQAAASVVLDLRGEYGAGIELIKKERARMAAALAATGCIEVFPSSSNFLLVRMREGSKVRARLRDEFSILVRDVSAMPELENCLRITVGTPEENDRIIQAVSTLSKEYAS